MIVRTVYRIWEFQIFGNPLSLSDTMIILTNRAIEELGKLLATRAKSPESGLRLAVRRGGCAGWQYEMMVADPEDGDEIVQSGAARVIVAADSLDRLRGCEVDFSDDLTDAGFKIHNPQASRSCGCGTSFETAEAVGESVSDGEACGTN
ncbi:MAG: iron-sulfur cluster assembly accessory protein [Akkermansiaceae bacterium]|nr:iron-sulfur cluster assembly accessory protein [Akkermansiaceae bacterium]